MSALRHRWSNDLLCACSERCAEFGEPPCFDIDRSAGPCADCLRECRFEVVEPLDPKAVVRELL